MSEEEEIIIQRILVLPTNGTTPNAEDRAHDAQMLRDLANRVEAGDVRVRLSGKPA